MNTATEGRLRNGPAPDKKTSFRPNSSLWAAILMVIGGGICISFSAIFVKASGVSATSALFYRCFFGGLALAVLGFFTRESYRAKPKTYGILGIVVLCFSMDLVFWHNSIFHVGPGMATILANFHVFFIALIGFLIFKEKLSIQLKVGLPLAFAGLWLILGVKPEGLDHDLISGVGQGLFASWWYALYVLVLRHSQKMGERISPIASITVISLGCALFGFIVCMARGDSLMIPTAFSGVMLLAYGVTGQALGGLLFTWGLPRLPASLGGPLMLVQPALAFTWDILFFNLPATKLTLLGAVITLGAIYLTVNGQMKLENRTKSAK